MIDEIYSQMERMKSPPTMVQFIDVYTDAVTRLEQKIADKDERIRELLHRPDLYLHHRLGRADQCAIRRLFGGRCGALFNALQHQN